MKNKELNIKITYEEALLLFHYFDDRKLNEIAEKCFENNQNIVMILGRIISQIESVITEPFPKDYEKFIKEAMDITIARNGNFNIDFGE